MRPFWKIALPLSLAVLAAVPASAKGPSFSCRGNLTRVERMICNDPELSRLDRQVARLYRSAGGADEATTDVKTYVRGALVSRNRCRSASCVRDVLQDEIDFLNDNQGGGY